jgi:hypothetical protein
VFHRNADDDAPTVLTSELFVALIWAAAQVDDDLAVAVAGAWSMSETGMCWE